MARISKFPTNAVADDFPKRQNTAKRINEDSLHDTILQLAWNDIKTFLFLEANCASRKPISMDEKTKHKLQSLHLIDQNGYSPLSVYRVMRSISQKSHDQNCYKML